MDVPGWVLLIGTFLWVVMLAAVEAYTAMNGLPTISDRVRVLGDTRIVLVLTAFVSGYLFAHFFDRPGKTPAGPPSVDEVLEADRDPERTDAD